MRYPIMSWRRCALELSNNLRFFASHRGQILPGPGERCMTFHVRGPSFGDVVSAGPGRCHFPKLQIIFQGLDAGITVENRLEFGIEKVTSKSPEVLGKIVANAVA